MEIKELYLKALFCCSACDGDIANEEILLIKNICDSDPLFENYDIITVLNDYVNRINLIGKKFLKEFLNNVVESKLSEEQELKLVDLAFRIIEADNVIEYSEVKFFKKIRARLNISDDDILSLYPDKEDFLLPDLRVFEDPELSDVQFDMIEIA